ncbi:hypothetical protein Pint_17912 [Pistacia integerrima]|uniref:Uncharacterized protein n=1 Tax=Pistacia integerrima TaxID=434235 RepID=A0ACC0YYN2_9ROSI|nr:hypothetical protein Pint_17912 [Pistacia integerrima]
MTLGGHGFCFAHSHLYLKGLEILLSPLGFLVTI